jgi:hypothetical protein
MFVEAMATPQVESKILWPGDQLAVGWVVTPRVLLVITSAVANSFIVYALSATVFNVKH